MTAQSDKKLMERIQQGDENAFADLVSRYREPLFHHMVRLIRDQAAAEDLLQEAFLRVWIRADQWKESGTCRGWLYTITTNLGRNWLRTVSRRRENPLELRASPEDEEEDASSVGPEQAAVEAESSRRLGRLVNQLPEEKRAVVRLIYEHELAPQEVAQLLDIPPGTVRSRLHHARLKLAKLWEAEDWEA